VRLAGAQEAPLGPPPRPGRKRDLRGPQAYTTSPSPPDEFFTLEFCVRQILFVRFSERSATR